MGFRERSHGVKIVCQVTLPNVALLSRPEAIVLIHNFRTNYAGYSQIKSVFDREYVRCKNLHGYDRIAQYYFRPGDYDSGDKDGVVDGGGSDEDSDK